MNILLDTHIAVWAITDDPRLSARARKIILDPDILLPDRSTVSSDG